VPRPLTKAEKAQILLKSGGDRKRLTRTLDRALVVTREESGQSRNIYYVDVGELARAAGQRNILIDDMGLDDD
jgi:hypothetical protein